MVKCVNLLTSGGQTGKQLALLIASGARGAKFMLKFNASGPGSSGPTALDCAKSNVTKGKRSDANKVLIAATGPDREAARVVVDFIEKVRALKNARNRVAEWNSPRPDLQGESLSNCYIDALAQDLQYSMVSLLTCTEGAGQFPIYESKLLRSILYLLEVRFPNHTAGD